MSEKESKETIKVEDAIHFEIAELDDMDLDSVAGGIIKEPTNGSQCSCSNTLC